METTTETQVTQQQTNNQHQSEEVSVAPPPPVTPEELLEAKEALKMAHIDMYTKSDDLYYACFLQRVKIHWEGHNTPTAGVYVTSRIHLEINPRFWLGLTHDLRKETIRHEIMHVLDLHCSRLWYGYDQGLLNVAMDAYINEKLPLLRDHPDSFISIAKVNKKMEQHHDTIRLTNEDVSELMYEKMRAVLPFDPNGGQGGGDSRGGFGKHVDDHSTWQKSDKNESVNKSVVQQAANGAAASVGIGNLPSHIMSALSRLNKAKVNWRNELRHFFVRSIKSEKTSSRSRRNRRYGLLQPGKKKDFKMKVAWCADESGSMSDAQIAQIYAEADKAVDLGIEIWYIACDTEVAKVFKYEKGMKIERNACGGTLYQPGFDKAMELEVDGIVYCGDFDTADRPNDPKIPVLWLGVNTKSEAPGKFGKTVYVEFDEEYKV